MTLTVGFRLGNDVTTRQVTVLVTQSGVLHRAQGIYGKLARLSRPERSPAVNNPIPALQGEHPLARPIADLRRHHAAYTTNGYTRLLVPPAVVRLDLDEDQPLTAVAHRELFEAFVGAAPTTPQSLEAAITAFRTELGLPSRPEHIRAPREKVLPRRVAAMLRTLENGSALTSARQRAVRWTVTGQDVRLHVGPTGEVLDRAAVAELQAALSAWLHFTRDTGQPASQGDSPA
ncbi:hypothetical protein [Streptomyces palmae]|uniref:Uncharacterized protein n=1 Tax=Streptomyces palmae TaxID=1701085 RepID=A0A4Z0HAA9_9ACTN|nr:hypothetical protein [Streptomyces palmae]TGB10826.1 hypothetical protein E4099_12500 [Streptomyces palmae]